MATQFVVAMITALTRNCKIAWRVMHCTLCIIGCVMSDACHAELKYPQDGGRGEKG